MKKEHLFSTKLYKRSILLFSLLIISNCSSSLDLNLENKDVNSFLISNFKDIKKSLKRHNKIDIEKIINSKGENILSGNHESIIPDYSGKKEIITIKGKFNKSIIDKEKIFFENEENLLNISYSGEDYPKTKILIDETILLKPIEVSDNQIKVEIDTTAIPDYYLQGEHKLTILSKDKEETSVMINIGKPELLKTSLSPFIEDIKILKSSDITFDKDVKEFVFKTQNKENINNIINFLKNIPVALKITGKNLMMYHGFSYIIVDGKKVNSHITSISKKSDGSFLYESIIHINSFDFNKNNNHSISYYTPFGVSFKKF